MRQQTLNEVSPDVSCPICGGDFETEQGMKSHHAQIHGESLAGVSVECANCDSSFRVPESRQNRTENICCSKECQSQYRIENIDPEDHPRWNGGKETTECAWCSNTIKRHPSALKRDDRHYCNQECRGKYRSEHLVGEDSHAWRGGPVDVACSNCNTSLTRQQHQMEEHEEFFCGVGCEGEWKREHASKYFEDRLKKRIEAECGECDESFTHPPSAERRFCSRECYMRWRTGRFTGENSWSYKERIQLECGQCGGEFSVIPSREGRTFCSKECADQSRAEVTGPAHPLWKGGVNWYRAIRSALGPTGWHTQRQKYLDDECELCEATDSTLALHHIVPVLSGGENAEYNYMTLCRGCHSTAERYIQQFDPFDSVLVE